MKNIMAAFFLISHPACSYSMFNNSTCMISFFTTKNISLNFSNCIFRKVCYGKGLRALRKFLPKPYFVQTEGALEKFLMIINSQDEVLPLVYHSL